MSEGEGLTVNVPIKTTFDGTGAKQAEQGLKGVGEHAEGASAQLKEMGYSAKALKEMLLETVAAAELLKQFKEGAEEVMALEQAFRELDRSTARFKADGAKVREEVESLAKDMAKVAGVADHETIPALVKMYSQFGNMEEVQARANLATDIAIAKNMKWNDALHIVEMAAGGNTRALREVGVFLDSTGNKSKDATIAIEELQKRFKGAADNAGGLKVELARLNAQFEEIRAEVAEKLIHVFVAFANGAKTAFTYAAAAVLTFGEQIDYRWQQLKIRYEQAKDWLSGDFGAAKAKNAELEKLEIQHGQRIAAIAEGTLEVLDEIDKSGAQKKLARGGEVHATERKGENTALIEHAKAMKAMLDLDIKYLDALEKAAATKYDKQAIEEKKIQKERERDEWALIAEKRKSDEAIFVLEAEKNAKLKALRNERLRDDTKFGQDEVKVEANQVMETEKLWQGLYQTLYKLEVHDAEVKKKLGNEETQLYASIADSAISVAQTAFGHEKEFAIAKAIINTYLGATNALSQGDTYTAVLRAAAIIAAGLADVAVITSTGVAGGSSGTGSSNGPGFSQPGVGGGFDDPANDRAAYMAGRGWAMDAVRQLTGGLSSGWQSGMQQFGGMRGNTTNDNRKTVTVNLNATVTNPNDRAALLALYRNTQNVVRQVESARITAKAARTT